MIEISMKKQLKPFSFPNYLRTNSDDSIDVTNLTVDEATQYWNKMLPLWLEHIKARRKYIAGDHNV